MPPRSRWYVLLYYLMISGLAFGGTIAATVLAGRNPDPIDAWLLKCLLILVLVSALTSLYLRRDGLRWRHYGFRAEARTFQHVLIGLLAGLVLTMAWAAIVACWAPYSLQWNQFMTTRALVMGSISTVAIGMAEEIGYRSYGMERLETGFGPMAAILFPSALFAFVHTTGGMPWMAALFVVGSCSVLYGALILLTRSVPLVAAFHIGNNLAQDALLRTGEGSLWTAVFISPGSLEKQWLTIWVSMAMLNLAIAAVIWRRWRAAGSPGWQERAVD